MLKLVTIVFTLSYWPVNLYLANSPTNFLEYAVPAILLGISFFLYIKYPKYYLVPILFIGIFEKKLVLLPLIFIIFELVYKTSKQSWILLGVSLLILIFSFKVFVGQSIFVKDYEGEQLVIRNIHLYPNVVMARVFQNKPRIYLNKLTSNFFVLTDPNNYFFGLHPRPIPIDNQNLHKYPFFSIIFFFVGLFSLNNNKYKRFIIFSSIAAIITLSLLTNFDRNDFILYVPISLIITYGIKKIF